MSRPPGKGPAWPSAGAWVTHRHPSWVATFSYDRESLTEPVAASAHAI